MTDSQASAGDPILAELRRRHPDVRVVLLPPPGPTVPDPAEVAPLDVDDVRARALHVREVLDSVMLRLVATGRWPADEAPTRSTSHWVERPDGAVHTLAVGLDLPDAETATATLEDVGDLLLARGFDARPVAGRRARLLASDEYCLLDAEAREHTLRVSVESLPAPVTADDLRRLRLEARS